MWLFLHRERIKNDFVKILGGRRAKERLGQRKTELDKEVL